MAPSDASKAQEQNQAKDKSTDKEDVEKSKTEEEQFDEVLKMKVNKSMNQKELSQLRK